MPEPAPAYQGRFEAVLVLFTVVIFIATLALNELLFKAFEFGPGINWIYLPAGVRMLALLMFADAGGLGILLASWIVCFFWLFPDDYLRSFMGGIVAPAAPYLCYRGAQAWFGIKPSLANLTPRRLLLCALAYSFASPLLHHIWFALHGDKVNLLRGFGAMFAGDLAAR